MNKSELSQLKYLNKEIEILQKQINNAEAAVDARMTVDSVAGSSPVWPYTKHTIRIEGIDIVGYKRQVNRLRNKLNRRLEELMSKREELEEYISTVPDSEMRMILTLRYVEGLTWEEIEEELGISYRTAQRKFRKWQQGKCR